MGEPTDVAATRAAYDRVARDYSRLVADEVPGKAVDRAMLAAFAELTIARQSGLPVADVGCGPGHVTAHFAALGVDVLGIDLSPGMIAVARETHPSLSFEVGSMIDLDVATEGLAGLVAWYSVIHTPPERRADVFAEFARVVEAGGYLLLAFQTGDEIRHIERAYGHDVDLAAWRLPVEGTLAAVEAAGFAREAYLVRAPLDSEKTPQAFLLLRRVGPQVESDS